MKKVKCMWYDMYPDLNFGSCPCSDRNIVTKKDFVREPNTVKSIIWNTTNVLVCVKLKMKNKLPFLT